MEFLYVLMIVFGVFVVAFALLGISGIIKGREFRGGCASNNPMLKDKIGECGLCGKKADEACKMPEVHKSA